MKDIAEKSNGREAMRLELGLLLAETERLSESSAVTNAENEIVNETDIDSCYSFTLQSSSPF